MTNDEGVLTSDAREDERWDTAASIVQMGIREAICVPMKGRYDVVGVIYIDTSISPQRILQGRGAQKRRRSVDHQVGHQRLTHAGNCPSSRQPRFANAAVLCMALP